MPRMVRPDATIIIPTRDRPNWLPRTLLSALEQQGTEAEIIIVDDGSTTPVSERLTLEAQSRLRVLRNPSSLGVARARNRGIDEARGEWIAFLDDDDVWAPDKLSRDLAGAREGADFAYSGGMTIDDQGEVLNVFDAPPAGEQLYRGALARTGQVPISMSNLLVRAELLRSIDGFDPEFSMMEDWDLLIRLTAIGEGAATPDHLVGYTIHSGGMHNDREAAADERHRLERKHADARAAAGVTIDEASWWRWRASTLRRQGDRRRTAAALAKVGWYTRDPTMVLRAAAMRIGGESAMTGARRVLGREREGPEAPEWLVAAVDPDPEALRAIWRR
jgi:glycosyltransferase involved in cell wall biosynthesis